ncbi:unnamed protein product, partial [Prorocentrum cordatum]
PLWLGQRSGRVHCPACAMAVERVGRLISRPTVARQPTQPPAWLGAPPGAGHVLAVQRDWSPCRVLPCPQAVARCSVGCAPADSGAAGHVRGLAAGAEVTPTSRRPALAQAQVSRLPSRSMPPAAVSERAAAQLSAQAQGLCSKLEGLLAAAGRGVARASGRQRAAPSSAERFVELVERMAQLEALVDEVSASGLLHQPMGSDPGLRTVAGSLLDAMRRRQEANTVVRQPSVAYAWPERGGTPLPTSRVPTPSVPTPGRSEAAAPAWAPAARPAAPPWQPGCSASRCSSPQKPRPSGPGELPARGAWTPRPCQAAGLQPALSLPLAAGPGGCLVGCVGGGPGGCDAPWPPAPAAASGPARAFSAPRPVTSRRATSPTRLAVLTAGVAAPPVLGAAACHPMAGTPGAPLGAPLAPPLALWSPSPGQLLQGELGPVPAPFATPPPPGGARPSGPESVEGKIREWLETIPIGGGADRGWDDEQISEIAQFARGEGLSDLPAEDLYKRYVEHQVEVGLAQAGA